MKMTKTVQPKKKKVASLDAKKSRAGWLFVLPFVIGFVLLYIPMLFQSIEFSFSEIKLLTNAGGGGGGYELTFVGWANYNKALFSDANFVRVLTSSLKQLVLDVPAIVIFSLFMAIVLNQKMVGRAAFRAIFFIPVILTTGLIDQIDQSNAIMNYMGSGRYRYRCGGSFGRLRRHGNRQCTRYHGTVRQYGRRYRACELCCGCRKQHFQHC